ncbi:hypothetical protein [Methanomassiliicoccus luminyensis]|uniref:hypothetical protein n=1 Tax=Methanomassiliicoccus luminyensis TaxID=1080712 RepID=UPI0003811371|nr:hypothetical protein [Methanomassiliicoccus luminyensis]
MAGVPIQDQRQKGLMWRSVLTIVASFAWLVFIVIWLYFFTGDLSSSQNLAVMLVSVLILLAVLIVAWVTWGIKYPRPQMPQGYGYYLPNPKKKSVIGGLTGIIWLTFMVIWLFFFASDFTLYQNLGAVLASALIVFGAGWAISMLVR